MCLLAFTSIYAYCQMMFSIFSLTTNMLNTVNSIAQVEKPPSESNEAVLFKSIVRRSYGSLLLSFTSHLALSFMKCNQWLMICDT